MIDALYSGEYNYISRIHHSLSYLGVDVSSVIRPIIWMISSMMWGRFASSSYLALFKANVSDMTALIDCDMTLSMKRHH